MTGWGLGVGSIGHFVDSNCALPPCFAAAVPGAPVSHSFCAVHHAMALEPRRQGGATR